MNHLKPLFLVFFLSIYGIAFTQTIGIEAFATGFDKPVNIKNAGDDRLFVVEQDGYIQILNSDGSVNDTAFLDIDSSVSQISGIGDERGLLGLVFHPDYATNGYFYVYYINNSNDTVVSRFAKDADDDDLADATSESILLTIDQPFINHNGGDLAFGSDGYLYIATGDGGSGGDPGNRAQSLLSYHGKLLRIDVDNTDGATNYSIPADNPFFESTTELEEIWAYGLRNPWKFSFDKLTGDLWVADVGQNVYEEINKVAPDLAGLNYGWRCYEGNTIYNNTGCPDSSTLTFPVVDYSHTANGPFKCSVTGGYVYRGSNQPTLQGLYFFADYCSDEIGYLTEDNGDYTITYSSVFSGNNWSTFGESNTGELFVGGLTSGNIFRIIDSSLSLGEDEISQVKISPNPSNTNIILNFDAFNTPLSIDLFDIQGKLIMSLENNIQNNQEISVRHLESGLYLVHLTMENGQKLVKKFIKK
ncbi:MAG: hypothetical protein BM564_07135 [Bacteroidetes bacterium MedPE-SWsnd-G2]|nr:MAG: hypothetical protein BM564_07135 [Bacteroidetes bacterium MedPE-SWsnd-G2]